MNNKIYLLLFTLVSCTTIHSMLKEPAKLVMPENLALPIKELWLNIIARCKAKQQLQRTCTYFRDFASPANEAIFLQNPLIIKSKLLKQYAIYFADQECSKNNTAIVSNLLDQGLDPNTQDESAYVRYRTTHNNSKIHTNKSLLYYAVENENIATINLLLNHPLLITEKVVSPFKLALELNLIEIAKSLITQKTVKILRSEYRYKGTNHTIDVLKHILSFKENDSDVSDFLFECLTRATQKGYVKLAQFILDYAANNNYALLEKGRLLVSTDYPSMLKLLRKHGAPLDDVVNSNNLRDAIQHGNINTVLLLINLGVNLAPRPGEESLLHRIICGYIGQESGRIPILKMLLNKGININEKCGPTNNTPLICAIHGLKIKAIEFLLVQPDIDVNAKNNSGKTPLDITIEKQKPFIEQGGHGQYIYRNIIELLVEHGGKTSDQLAQEK